MMIPDLDVNEGINKPIDKVKKPWKLPNPTHYAFYNVNIIDTLNGITIKDSMVLIKDGNIEGVFPKSYSYDKKIYESIDCKGKYLCPGLFDFHVHIVAVQGENGLRRTMRLPKTTMLMRVGSHCKAMLERGFTSIRDCGGLEHFVVDAINDNVIHGPRSFICGFAISQTGGHGDMRETDLPGFAADSCECHLTNLGVVADGVSECMKVTRENFRRGASFIKVMSGGGVASPSDKISHLQFTEDELKSIVEVASTYGSYVTAHAYTPESIKRCVKYGVKGIEHGNLIDAESAKLMAENGCFLTPTLVSYKVLASDQFSEFLPEDAKSKNAIVLKKGLESLLIAKNHGVTICYGSDLLGNLSAYQSNEFLVRSKVLNSVEILQSATINPAKIMKCEKLIGQIEQGFYADMILLEKNPLEDITILDKPEENLMFVMKAGLVYHTKWDGIKSDVPTSIVYS